MLASSLLLAVAGMVGFASAQNSTAGSYPYTVAPGEFSAMQKQQFCLAQTNSCPSICGGPANPNTCDSTSLQWTCTCLNGNQPNVSMYQNTIPFFECLQYRADCVKQTDDARQQQACNAIPCATILPMNAAANTGGVIVAASTAASTAAAAAATTPATSTVNAVAAASSGASTGTASAAGSAAASSAASSASAAASPSASHSDANAVDLQMMGTLGTGAFAVFLALFGFAL